MWAPAMADFPFLQDLFDAIARTLPRGLRGYVEPALILVGAALLGVLVRHTLFRWLCKLTARNKVPYDDIIAEGLTRRVVGWTILGTLYLQLEALPWKPRTIAGAQNVVAALLIVSVTLVLVRMVSALVQAYGLTRAAGIGGTTLIRYIAVVALLFIGTVSVLALFGISVVPAITALGIGGLAVALAFQDTLANVFSGLNLTLSRQVRVGDYIEIDSKVGVDHVDGFVVDIGWRATSLRTLTGLLIFIPNKKLAETVMINYSRDPGMSVELAFHVAVDCDPEHIEALVVDEMKLAAAALPGLRQDEPALVRFKAFGEWALQFKVFVPICDFQDRYYLQHELMKRLHRRLRAENITIPLPQLRLEALTGAKA